jgi:hypothetical protein
MQEIIHCPSCQRRLQVPDTLVGQDVQCPTCGATFVASLGGASPRPAERALEENLPRLDVGPRASVELPERRRPEDEDNDDYDEDDRYRRRRRRDLAPHRGNVVLTLGILSLVLLVPVGPILGPIAWAMASTDLAEIRDGRMDPEGEAVTNAGRICGMIGTLLSVLGLLLCCLWIFAAAVNGPRGF